MARIAHSTITSVFDRVSSALVDKSGSVISRAEAKQVADGFRANGDADAAYVIELAYAKADAVDTTKYAKTTAADIGTVRQALVAALADADGGTTGAPNGLSKAELAALPAAFRPMVLTLVNMSKLEALPKKPGPKALATFQKAIDHATALMKAADGGNGKLSLAEVKALAGKLADAGRATEALVVSNLFTMAKAQAGKGKSVTDAKIDGVAAWATKQIKKHDKEAPGFSNTEIGGMPVTWAALLRLGQMVEGGIAQPTLPSAPAAPSAFAAFSKQDRVGQFYTALGAAKGGAPAIALGAVPAAARANIDKDINKMVQEIEWDGRTAAVTYHAVTLDDAGTSKTVGYAANVGIKDESNNDISWRYVYDVQGKLLGREYAGAKETPPLGGALPFRSATDDYYLTSDDWTPTTTMSDPEFRALFQTTQTNEAAFLINLMRGHMAPNVFLYRRDESDNSVPAGAGQWQVGTKVRDGQEYHLTKWNDVDDNSHTLWFTKNGSDFELAVWNYDN